MTITERKQKDGLNASFPKACRLRASREFQIVYREGRRRTSRSFVAFILPTRKTVTRFGLTTPRKLGKAHDRNRIRRRVREILRCERSLLPVGRDIVLNPRRSVLDRDWEELRTELLLLLR